MITAKIKFSCLLCGQDKNFYIMPREQKIGKGKLDYIHSKTEYKIVCKACGKEYNLKITIKP